MPPITAPIKIVTKTTFSSVVRTAGFHNDLRGNHYNPLRGTCI